MTTFTATVSGLESTAYTLEKRDPCTSGQQKHVATLAMAIATKMGFDKNRRLY